jgi:hypothetical protein
VTASRPVAPKGSKPGGVGSGAGGLAKDGGGSKKQKKGGKTGAAEAHAVPQQKPAGKHGKQASRGGPAGEAAPAPGSVSAAQQALTKLSASLRGEAPRGVGGGGGGGAAAVLVSPTDARVSALRSKGEAALAAAVASFDKARRDHPSSDDKWMQTVLKSGTLSDKIAAMSLLVQQSPLHTLSTLDQLLSLAKKKARREAQLASDALLDLFQTSLLPSDRELRRFHEQPSLLVGTPTPQHLMFWFFEDALKQRFRDFVESMESALQDALMHFKIATVKRAGLLAQDKPELRRTLLAIVVSRLGDVERKVRFRGSSCCRQLLALVEVFR